MLRQRDEFNLVAWHLAEVASFPFRLSLLDAFLARGDEVPPDVARAIHRRAAEDDEMRVGRGADRRPVSRLEHHQLSGCELVAGDIDRALHNIQRALLVSRIERPTGGATADAARD